MKSKKSAFVVEGISDTVKKTGALENETPKLQRSIDVSKTSKFQNALIAFRKNVFAFYNF